MELITVGQWKIRPSEIAAFKVDQATKKTTPTGDFITYTVILKSGKECVGEADTKLAATIADHLKEPKPKA